ncbi:MAG: chromosome partitioning protein ParA, partial [Polaromonas sp.]|nr:chromosome partitioning protein ParA [Polaromonas sp.]
MRSLYPGQQLEVSTPNLTFGIAQAGDYRIDADPAGDTTRVQVHSGGGTAYGDAGTALELSRNQQATFTGTQLAAGNAPQGSDGFDRWADARDQLEERSVAARYVPREVVGYQQLDAYGDWQQDADYGPVWLPRAVPMNWAPYRVGHWSWIAPWGWTWIDDAPWGFAPSHYGRWTQIGPRWAWAPGRIAPRPVYAPALVAFIGGTAGGATWNVAIGPGRPPQPAFGWFPLAPGEAFRPAYRVSPRYVGSVNQNLVVHRVPGDAARGHRYQRHEGAVSVARADDFIGGRPIRALPQAVQAADLRRG